jgi:hypothetical protein
VAGRLLSVVFAADRPQCPGPDGVCVDLGAPSNPQPFNWSCLDGCATAGDCRVGYNCVDGACLPLPVCGNGVPEAGEGCDDGNQLNNDDCPDGPGGTCQPASCFDGFLQTTGAGPGPFETGLDCGGPCLQCEGLACTTSAECRNDNCLPGVLLCADLWINEIHYDNTGADSGEAIELVGTAGMDVSGWSLVLYNGGTTHNGVVYDTIVLSGVFPNQQGLKGTLSFAQAGIQNGPNDGIALVHAATGTVLQLLSYDGDFTATAGPALGMGSVEIPVDENPAPAVGQSLQLSGTGDVYADFTWQSPGAATFGQVNTGQNLVP